MAPSVFDLPPFVVGPYGLKVQACPRPRMPDRRTHIHVDWNAGALLLRDDLSEQQALRALMRGIVAAIHYRSGLNDSSDEESFTHSLSSGLVELAGTSPRFWFELHAYLDEYFGHPETWGPLAGGALAPGVVRPPIQLRLGRRRCAIEWIAEERWPMPDAYGLYTPGQHLIELRKGLQGSNKALVALHEGIHFLHDCYKLADTHDEGTFRRKQVEGLLCLLEQNPAFWAWWLQQVSTGTRRTWALAAH